MINSADVISLILKVLPKYIFLFREEVFFSHGKINKTNRLTAFFFVCDMKIAAYEALC